MFDLFPEGGLISMVAQATLAVKIVLGFLAGMSVLSWAIIITKLFTLGRAKRLVSEGYELFLTAEDLGSGLQELSRNSNGPLTNVSTKAVKEYRKLERADIERERKRYLVKDTLERMLSQGVNAEMKILSSHISFLATCANAAPFIGLFGTVWGIMDAFHEIGLQQSAALATVAPGISEALVATAIGLAVAIPATIAYNYFRAVLTTLQNEMSNFSGAFLNRVEREVSWAQNKSGKRNEV